MVPRLPIARLLAALLALSLAAVPAAAEQVRARVGDTEIAAERLGTAGPVVVFESGQGGPMAGWAEVAGRLAACMRVVLYDRPGIGASGPRAHAAPVLAATDHHDTPEREALWRRVQADTAALSPKGRPEVVTGSGHFIQTDGPRPSSAR